MPFKVLIFMKSMDFKVTDTKAIKEFEKTKNWCDYFQLEGVHSSELELTDPGNCLGFSSWDGENKTLTLGYNPKSPSDFNKIISKCTCVKVY